MEARRKLSECTGGMLNVQLFNELLLLPRATSTSEKGFVRVAMSFDEVDQMLADIDRAAMADTCHVQILNSAGRRFFDGFQSRSGAPHARVCSTGGNAFRLRYFEANFPASPCIRRLEPLHGSIKKLLKSDVQLNIGKIIEAFSSLMKAIQNYIVLEDSTRMAGLQSYRYFHREGNRQHLGQNVICVWIEAEEVK